MRARTGMVAGLVIRGTGARYPRSGTGYNYVVGRDGTWGCATRYGADAIKGAERVGGGGGKPDACPRDGCGRTAVLNLFKASWC